MAGPLIEIRSATPDEMPEVVASIVAAFITDPVSRFACPSPYDYLRAMPLATRAFGGGSFELGDLAVTAVPVDHRPESLAFRFADAGGAVAAVSGDCGPCDGLVEVARGADLLVCECSMPDALALPLHLTPGLAARAAAEAGVSTLCLTHFYPECVGHDLEAEARAHFDGRLVLGTDLMTFELGES